MKTHTQSQQTDSSSVQAKAQNQAEKSSILQAYKNKTAQLAESEEQEKPAQLKENKTGLPDQLKSGVENLSGHSLDDVKVHYNSSQPAALQAHAYAQGTDIHVAPGQEKHLPHEAWHVVQQKQGRVQPTKQMKGTVPVNDDAGLEKEADVMGAKAMHTNTATTQRKEIETPIKNSKTVLQGAFTGPNLQHNNPVNITYGGHQFTPGGVQNNTNCGTNNSIVTAGEQKNTASSQPGSPANLDTYKTGFSRAGGLVRDPSRNQTSTRIHLINHRLEDSGNTQNVASNIFLGSQRSNNPTHLNSVENHVIRSLSYATRQNAAYENSLAQAQTLNMVAGTPVTYWDANHIPPTNVLPLALRNNGWIDGNGNVSNVYIPDPSQQPPAKKQKTATGAAQVPPGVYINPLTKALPKNLWLRYTVSANYGNAPGFVTGNINHERAQNGGNVNPINPNLENTIQNFENNWKNNAFPVDFTSNASYYFSSWIPGTPYHQFNEAPETIASDL